MSQKPDTKTHQNSKLVVKYKSLQWKATCKTNILIKSMRKRVGMDRAGKRRWTNTVHGQFWKFVHILNCVMSYLLGLLHAEEAWPIGLIICLGHNLLQGQNISLLKLNLNEYKVLALTDGSIYYKSSVLIPLDRNIEKWLPISACSLLYPLRDTVAMNELLCLKNVGAQISLFFTSYE